MTGRLFMVVALLLSAATINAQITRNSPVRSLSSEDDHSASLALRFDQVLPGNGRVVNVNKGTGIHNRVYNYVDYLALTNGDIFSILEYRDYPYMWYNPDMYSMFVGGIRDTIKLASYGVVLHPFYNGWNDPGMYAPGEMVMSESDDYTVDSIIAYGVYGRNPNKPNIVDTLRFAFSYGFGAQTNIETFFSPAMATRYNVDTLFSAAFAYDSQTHTMMKPAGSSGPPVVYKYIYLRNTDTGRTMFAIPANISVPGGNLFGVSITFRSGESYDPFVDTAYLTSLINPSVPYKYGMFRPLIFRESRTAFPTYTKRNYNSGQYRQLPELPSNEGRYSPMWLWAVNGAPSAYQYPYVDFKVKCTNCRSLSVPELSSSILIGNVYPNPANISVTIPITLRQSENVTISVSNTIGQVVAMQNLGKIAAYQPIKPFLRTESLADGLYFLTVTANDNRATSRFVVAH